MSPDLCSETKQRFTTGQELPKCGVCDPVPEMMAAVTVPPFICDKEKWKKRPVGGFWVIPLRCWPAEVGWPTILVSHFYH